MIERTFTTIPEGKIEKADDRSYLTNLGYSSEEDWKTLLQSKRILIISEAGSGKTYECEHQCKRLWDAGEPAFFLELATLAKSDLRAMLSTDEEKRFDGWLSAQSGIATFFLDSYDELKLSLGSFKQALKSLEKSINGRLGRARIVITTRPIPFDEDAVRCLLPVPLPATEVAANGEAFAQIAVHGVQDKNLDEKDDKCRPDWLTVALLPFSDNQIVDFARLHGVSDPEEMLIDLKSRNAQDFARRPQDLIELSADWRDYKRIRSHKDQVEGNIRIKSKPREDRPEAAELSVEQAMDGASRLALAMMMTRKLTIRHSAESDRGGTETAFDPSLILTDWKAAERKALLERPLFGFASYGRVRFHHRSVMEFLAAKRLQSLRSQGMSTGSLKRLIFVQTRGKTIVRHSKRAIAGWLALSEPLIFETLRDNEPDVIFNEGDPESLTVPQRIQVLRAFVERHGKGGWRGLRVPDIQIHRFASPALSDEINILWKGGIENHEIRELLLQLIEQGRSSKCADIAFSCASNPQAKLGERLRSIDALVSLNDTRLPSIVDKIAGHSSDWSEKLARLAVVRLFPKHMNVAQLFQILPRLKSGEDDIGDLIWHLPRVIEETINKPHELEDLRYRLTKLISEDLRWERNWPHYFSDKSHLRVILASVCLKLLAGAPSRECLISSIIVLVLSEGHQRLSSDEKVFQKLLQTLNGLPAEQACQLFWETDAFMQSRHSNENPWKRFVATTLHWSIQLKPDRDLDWIKQCLSDTKRSDAERAMILEAAARIGPSGDRWFTHMSEIKALVSDVPVLSLWIDERVKGARQKKGPEEWEIDQAKRKERAAIEEEKNLASWQQFWTSISEDPDNAFSDNQEGGTAWNLWRAMSRAGSRGRESGWNRQFIEDYLGIDIADRLRLTLMRQWRGERPTLTSEQPDGQKGTYLLKWQLGLAGIYAESEDPEWATKLSSAEAKLAARYATLELNSLPAWMDSLVEAHSAQVEETLGVELVKRLNTKTGKHFRSMFLQNIGHSPKSVIEIFLPRIKAWLDTKTTQLLINGEESGEIQRLSQVTQFLSKHGDASMGEYLCEFARNHLAIAPTDPFFSVWLHLLMRYDANSGVDVLEKRIKSVTPSQYSLAVTLLGSLFGELPESISLSNAQFSPPILLRLMRLIYRHVRPEDDVQHEGAYTPDMRDNAESARNTIVNVLLASKGEEGWKAKLEMATDPVCDHFKDRILAIAEESWSEEIDDIPFNDKQVVALDKSGEAPPATNEAMFTLLVDRLGDLDDLLLRDISPRESWAKNTEERIMRRDIARELAHLANGLYKIDQEAVTAEEKETDIRLRSTVSAHEAIIELKLADKRSARDLIETIERQLVTKYMASESSRSGCILITVAKVKKWDNPNGGSQINFSELIKLLRKEADRIVEKYGNVFRIHVHAFDLNPRLSTEKKK